MTGRYKKYSSLLLIFLAVNIALVGLFNFAVDSLGVFHDVRVEGFNKKKTEIIDTVRQLKILSMDDYKPDAVFIGSSRTDRSLHPDYLTGNGYPLRYYNLSILGTNVREMRRLLEHSYNVHGIKEVVIGLDFEMFNANTGTYKKDILSEGLLSKDIDGGSNLFYSEKIYLKFLFSMSALKSSFETVREQKSNIHVFKDNGAMEHVLNKRKFVKYGGVNGLLENVVGRYYKSAWKAPGERFVLADDSGWSVLDEIKKIIAFAIEKNIKINFFITPVHSYFEEARDYVGLYDLNRQWKREVASIIFSGNKRAGSGDMFRLWDFSGYNFVTEEEFPSVGDRSTQLKYFGDAVHFTKEAGELILARIFNFKNKNLKDDFGVLLTEENIETHFDSIELKRKVFIDSHLLELRNLSKWVDELDRNAEKH